MTQSTIARSVLVLCAAVLSACASAPLPPGRTADPAVLEISLDSTGTKLQVSPTDIDVRDGGSIVFKFKPPLKPKVLLCALEALFETYLPVSVTDSQITVGPLPKLNLRETETTPKLPFTAVAKVNGKWLALDPTVRVVP